MLTYFENPMNHRITAASRVIPKNIEPVETTFFGLVLLLSSCSPPARTKRKIVNSDMAENQAKLAFQGVAASSLLN